MIVGDVDEADGALAERAEIEGEPVAAPGFFIDGQQRGIVRARGGQAGFDAARRLFAAEAGRGGDDQGAGQLNLRGCEGSYGGSWAFMPAIRGEGPHGAVSPALARDGRRPRRASPRSRSGSRSPMLPRPVVSGACRPGALPEAPGSPALLPRSCMR